MRLSCHRYLVSQILVCKRLFGAYAPYAGVIRADLAGVFAFVEKGLMLLHRSNVSVLFLHATVQADLQRTSALFFTLSTFCMEARPIPLLSLP